MLLALLIPTAVVGVGARLDLAFSASVLASACMWTTGWYRWAWVSWPVEAVASGMTAAVMYQVLARMGLLARPAERATRRITVVGR